MNYQEIKKALIKYSDSYYNDNISLISDYDYDILLQEFKKEFPNDDIFNIVGSPIKVSNWNKKKHTIEMNSLNKVQTKDEFLKWTDNIKESNNDRYIFQPKLDGISISIEYINGNIISAITRGDSIEGENILQNVKKMKNVKLYLEKFTGSLRGEIIILQEDFDLVNNILIENNEKIMKNKRNCAGGISKRYDSKFSEYCTILYYDITGYFHTEEDKIKYIENNLKLKCCDYYICNKEDCIQLFYEYQNKIRINLPMDIDGCVIKHLNIQHQKNMGLIGPNPKAQIAWKFESISAITEVIDIEWSVGNNKTITPVAILKPVELMGSTVKRASLANVDIFNNTGLRVGDVVRVVKRNDIIPKIEEICQTNASGDLFEYPKVCPVCNESTEIEGKFLICNNPKCKGLEIGNLIKWINALNIMDVSEKTIELLYDHNLLKELCDFYTLNDQELINLPGLGIKSVNKLLTNLNDNKCVSLNVFIEGLNISDFSNSRAELLMESGYDTIEKIKNATIEELIKTKGIEIKTANKIVNGLKDKEEVIQKLFGVGITIKQEQKEIVMKDGILNGRSFCFTGAVERIDENGERYTRKRLQQLVIENGGENIDSVKVGLTYLVQVDINSQSSKTVKSKKLGIQIISEKQFFEMIGM